MVEKKKSSSGKWQHRQADSIEERFGLFDSPSKVLYKKQPVYEAALGEPVSRPLKAIGLTCGIGSMLVGARDMGYQVVGNVEWRDYYRYKSGRPSTFTQNFPGAFMARGVADVPQEIVDAIGPIDFAAGHPECLPGETKVFTSEGPRPIKEIRVGDLVLTHKGRFKRVVKTFCNLATPDTQIVRLYTSDKPGQKKAPHEFITLTGNHPVLTDRGWVDAERVNEGDVVYTLRTPCVVCGRPHRSHKQFCSTSCGAKHQWSRATEEDRKRLLDNCHSRTRDRVAKGEHQFTDPEVRSRAMRVLAKSKNGSNLERLMLWALREVGLPDPEAQYRVGKYFPDFAYPQVNILIECDGKAWHKDREKEALRDAYLRSQGWLVLHFEEDRIREDVLGCAEEVRRIIYNHQGEYSFAPQEVKGVERYNWTTERKVYNLTVEDDSSYVAKGFVVHNCGRYSNLSHSVALGDYKNSRSDDVSDIPLFLKLVARFKPRFFLMDDLPAAFGAFPMSEYVKMLPEYDLFPEWISNFGYGNIQKYRNRMFIVGALKSEGFAFVAGEQTHSRVLKDDILDLIGFDDIEDVKNHAQIDLDRIPGRYVNLRFYGDRPSWRELRDMNDVDHMKNIVYRTPEGVEKIRPGTRSPDWDGFCPVLSGGFNPLHPIRRLPMTVRERARIQGFPDDFIFHHDDEGPDQKVWEPYSSDGQRGIKQTGKAMPLQFCTYVAAQVKAHIEGTPWPTKSTRILKNQPMVDQAKRDFCALSGYANPKAVKEACWLDLPLSDYAEKSPYDGDDLL